MPLDVTVVFVMDEPFVARPFLFKLIGIAAFDALNSAGEMPSDVDRLMAIGWLCAFEKPFVAVRPFGKDFLMFAVGGSVCIGYRYTKELTVNFMYSKKVELVGIKSVNRPKKCTCCNGCSCM